MSDNAFIGSWTELALVQAMGCSLFGTKPVPKPVMTVC